MVKNLRNSMAILFLVTFLFSCDKGFEEANTSVDFVSSPNMDFELPYVELTMIDRNYYTHGYVIGPFVGHINNRASFPSVSAYDNDYSIEHWKWIFQQPLKTVADLIEHCKDDPNKVNYLSIARILRVYLFHQLTDVYGDLPYFEANRGYADQIITPKYDSQQAIYEDMFKELAEAIAAFSPDKPSPVTSDIVYKGDIAKWKKFANSLMLRLGLRIMNVEPENGGKWINQAVAGGLMTGSSDNFVVPYTSQTSGVGTTSNGVAHIFVSSSYLSSFRLASAFVDSLKNRNDPRTSIYCMREKLPLTSYQEGDHNPANQNGLRQFDASTPQLDSCSVPNIRTFGRYDAPYIHLSYAQVQLQLAECAFRGIITGDPKIYYEAGVRAAMEELSIFGPDGWNPGGVITVAQQDAYLAANPYDPANALKQINTQYWIETHYNWYETWANMRRSGYPDIYSSLDMSLSANLGASLPRRLYYSLGEAASNPDNLQEAIVRQGPNLITTRVWWDK